MDAGPLFSQRTILAMTKVVINECFGGFSLSPKACEQLGLESAHSDIARDDPALVKVVEELGQKSWGSCAELKVVEIPDDVKWHVDEYDGLEHVAEDHETWG